MGDVTGQARRAARQAEDSDWLDRIARIGLVAYGVVHVMIGWLAVQLALGDREGSADSTGAVQELAEQPLGGVLVWLVAVGMLLLALWRAVEAAVGYRDEDGFERLRHRVVSAGKAVVYAVIGISAVRVATGSGGGGGGGTDSTTAKIMQWPGGQLIVGAIGVAIIGVGLALLWRAWWSDKVDDDLDRTEAGRGYVWLGKAGYTAKGVAFGIVGGLFCYAALTHDPKKSGGLDQALREILDQPLGPVLLVLVGLGIAAYGLFSFAEARYWDR